MTVQDLREGTTRAAGLAERSKLRRELSRLDTVFFLISAMVVVDTIGAIAIGGGQAFTWLVVLFVTFFIPSALASAELGAAMPRGGRRLRVGAHGIRPLRRCAHVAAVLGRHADVAGRLGHGGGDGGVRAVRRRPVDGRRRTSSARCSSALATLAAVVPLRVRQVGADQRCDRADRACSPSSPSASSLYGVQHGVHGIAVGDLARPARVFIAVVPVLLYSFVGIELPSTAAEEMVDPRRDIPVAIARAGVGQALMYGDPDARRPDRAAGRADHLAARPDRRDADRLHRVRRLGRGRRHGRR